MQFSLTFNGLDKLRRGFAEAPDIAMEELEKALTDATLRLQSDVQGRYAKPGPEGANYSGNTARSIFAQTYRTPARVLGVVASPSPIALFVELGTRPHWAPMEDLQQWVEKKLGLSGEEAETAARGIQRKIGTRGTKGRFFFTKALEDNLPYLSRVLEDAAGRIARRLEGGKA